MKVSISQLNIVPMAIERNLRAMLSDIEAAKCKGSELVVFPELCLSGYLLADKWLDRHFCKDLMAINSELLDASHGICVIYGNVYEDTDICERLQQHGHFPNKDGRSRLYNAAYIIANGKFVKRTQPNAILPEGIQPKTLLPNYRFFDDQRYYFSLSDIAIDMGTSLESLCSPFELPSEEATTRIGLEICEDLWCKDYREHLQSKNVTRHLIKNGADMVVNISASPWTGGKHDARDRRIHFLKEDTERSGNSFVPFVYCNAAGAQNNGKNIIAFDGGSCVYRADAAIDTATEVAFDHQVIEFDSNKISVEPYARDEKPLINQKFAAICAGLKHLPDLLGWSNAPKFVVGLSGGIDSAVVVTLLTKVFGRDNVMAVNMPSIYNSTKTQDVAAHISNALSIDYHQIPVDDLVSAHEPIFTKLDSMYDSPDWMRRLSDENIQAKVRGTSILSNIAGRYGRMFTNNGNKVEIALGYATLYGDVGGVVAPIGDLTKAEVFEMARFLNAEVFNREVIPESLLPDELFQFSEDDIAPSAELRHEQIDPMKFGYHCALLEVATSFSKTGPEDVMQWYLSGELAEKLKINPELLSRWQLTDPQLFMEDLEWFYEAIRKSVFKRIQSPPIILTSPSAYGFDIRESQLPAWQSNEYKRLKDKVLNLQQYPG